MPDVQARTEIAIFVCACAVSPTTRVMRKSLKIALKTVAWFAFLLGIAIGLLWIRFRPDSEGRIVPLFEKIDLAAYRPFATAVGSSVRVRIFEGLPHQSWERDLLESELENKQTFKSHGHHFYSLEKTPTANDASTLHALATASSGFEEWGGMKLCGGYHPDWLIRWTSKDGAEHELHVCFGCHEAKLYGPGYRLYCDLGSDCYSGLKSILDRYHSQRPQRPAK